MTKLILLALCAFVYSSAIAQEEQKPCPCCGNEYRQFDFWVGNWNTYNPKGDIVGSNDIVLLQDKCIIQENWKAANGPYTGTSYNYYDASTKEWNQLWIDNQGSSLDLSGGLVDGSMVLIGDPAPGQDGKLYTSKVTWTPNEDGSVRQHWEAQAEGEETWQTWFDGLYRKK